jgi:hypothetical protein
VITTEGIPADICVFPARILPITEGYVRMKKMSGDKST